MLASCAAPSGPVTGVRNSSLRPYMLFDLGESMHADSRLEIADVGSFGFESSIDGRWGMGAGVEFDWGQNVDVRVGWIVRRLRASDIEGLSFASMTQVEAMGALLFEPLGEQASLAGWVPFLEMRLGLVPRTRIHTTFGPGTADIPLLVDASSYWKWGLGFGASRSLGSGLRFELGAIYEEAFAPAESDSILVISDVLQVPTHTEFSPRGWIFAGGFTWTL
ncbi:MAG: hypothetical protein ABGY32_11680 [bacterium]